MRNVLLWLFVIALSSVSFAQSSAQSGSSEGAKQQIMQIMDEGRQAALKGDTSWDTKYLADDFTQINALGQKFDKAEVLSQIKSGAIKYQAIDPIKRDFMVHGDSAVYQGRARLKATRNGQDISGEYVGTWFWVKQNGQWKLAASQSTKVQNPSK